MCNFGVFCKYQIKFPVPSPGSRRTGTPQPTSRAEEEAEQRCRHRPGTAASPDQPRAAMQTWVSTNSAANCPLRPAALRRRRLLAAGSSLCQGGLSASPRQGQVRALLGKLRDAGSSPVPGVLCCLPRLPTATGCEQSAAGALPAGGRGSLDSRRTTYKTRNYPREQKRVIYWLQ